MFCSEREQSAASTIEAEAPGDSFQCHRESAALPPAPCTLRTLWRCSDNADHNYGGKTLERGGRKVGPPIHCSMSATAAETQRARNGARGCSHEAG
jgi:hypothetical protein